MKIKHLHISDLGDKSRQSVIFIHGFPFDHKMWDAQMESLSGEFRCIAYDIRGLGNSDALGGQFTIEDLTDDLFMIIEELKLNKPVICGLSMGGYIALRAVEKKQTAFSALVLCNTKAAADDDAGRLNRAEAIKKINQLGAPAFVSDFIPNCFSDVALKEIKESYDALIERAKGFDPVGLKGCLLAMASRTDTSSFLEKIDIPVLVIAGAFDKIIPPEKMRLLASEIKDSEFAAAPMSAHVPPMENAGFVNDMIMGFIHRKISEQ
ncbi:MAG: alpha/beta fold hydrolase [Methanococcaceae archaeon]